MAVTQTRRALQTAPGGHRWLNRDRTCDGAPKHTAGDAAAAGRAARKGLVADPSAEQLWRMLMRAEHAAGNSAGVHQAWYGCLRELAAVEADLEPHPDTIALYRQLTGRTLLPHHEQPWRKGHRRPTGRQTAEADTAEADGAAATPDRR